MNKQTEALKMAIEALDNACMKIEKWTKGGKWTAGKEASLKCKEALKDIEISDAEIKQMLDDIEYYQKRVEELEQPQDAEQFFENGKKIAKWADEQNKQPAQELVVCHCGNPTFNLQTITHTKEKCFEKPAPSWQGCESLGDFDKLSKSECVDYIEYLRKEIDLLRFDSWQGLSDDEIEVIISNVRDDYYPWKDGMLFGRVARAIEQALKERNDNH